MDPISSIKVSGTSYEIKDSTARSAIVTLNNELNDKQDKLPLYTKEYDYTCSANDTNNGYIFFGNVIPTSEKAGETWYIHYKLYVDLASTNSTYQAYNKYCTGVYDCYVGCSGNSIIYKCFNRQYSTSYRPIYYHLLAYYTTTTENGTSVSWETKYVNRETNPIKVGFRVQSAYRVTDPRHYKVEVYEVYNCNFSFLDPLEKYGDIYTTAKYGACTTISADSGLQESGDANDTTSAILAYSLLKAGTNGIKMYSLIMQDKDGNWQSFYTGTGTTSTSKTVNPAQFRIGSKVYYVNRSTDVAADTTLGTSQVYTHKTLIDFRYSFPSITSSNTASAGNVGLTAYKPLYILGSIDNQGYFILDTTKWWAQDEPTTEDNKIYIKVCEAVYLDNSSNIGGQYRGDLYDNGTAYWFKDGMFQPYYKGTSGGGGDVNVIETVKVNGTALTPDANKAVNIDLSGYDKAPLIIEVYYNDTTVPNGTYTAIGDAISNNREVILIATDGEDNYYYSLLEDDSLYGSYLFSGLNETVYTAYIIQDDDSLDRSTVDFCPLDHSHGSITFYGTITSDTSVANGDKLVITDNSDSSKVKRSSISFDGSTTTKALTPKGTWETFLQSESSLSKGTTSGNGNAVTDISVSGHQITLTKGSTFLTSETDPTVPSWAKQTNKPSYNLDEVTDGTNRKLPTKVSDLTNDSGFISSHQSIKNLKTDNTTAQSTSSSEAIAGSGTINLHKVAKTGTYNDLIGLPTIPTESTVSGWGFTKNAGTITGITMNGASKGTSGVVDLGTVLTEHQNIKTINGQTITGTGNVTISGGIPIYDCGSNTNEIVGAFHSEDDGVYELQWISSSTLIGAIVGYKDGDYVKIVNQHFDQAVFYWDSSANKYVITDTITPQGYYSDYDLNNQITGPITSPFNLSGAQITQVLQELGLIDIELVEDENTGNFNNIVTPTSKSALDNVMYHTDWAIESYMNPNYDSNEDDPVDPDTGINGGLDTRIVNLDYVKLIPNSSTIPSVGSTVIAALYLVLADNYDYRTPSYLSSVEDVLGFDGAKFPQIKDICILEVKTTSTYQNFMYQTAYNLQVTEYLIFQNKKRTVGAALDSTDVGYGEFIVTDFTNTSWTSHSYFGGGGGSGDVTGPSSSTDEAVARFDSTTGKVIQNSVVTIDDSGNIFFPIATSTTFSNNAKIVLGNAWFGSNPSGGLSYGTRSGSTYSGKFVFESTGLRPVSSASGAVDIGTSSYKWRDIYMTGALKTGTYTLSIPSQSGTIAVTTDIPTAITIHTGTSTPSSSLGSNGDIYIKTSS